MDNWIRECVRSYKSEGYNVAQCMIRVQEILHLRFSRDLFTLVQSAFQVTP